MGWPKGKLRGPRNETPEVKAARAQKISIANRGRKFSDESRKKMSEAARLRRQKYGPEGYYQWNPDRKEQTRKNKLAKMVHGFVGRALAHTGKKKLGHGLELLGYTPQQLREHLEKQWRPGMTWDNHGRGPGKWHVDHIKPVVDFGPDATVGEINALSNLRPLWEHENLSLGGKLACERRYTKKSNF